MRYWWVNQNQTFKAETRGNFMWSPKANANAARNPFYDFMTEVSPGDVIFSFCDTRIKTLGIATGPAQTAPKPDFGNAGANWAEEGWFVPVYSLVFDSPWCRTRSCSCSTFSITSGSRCRGRHEGQL